MQPSDYEHAGGNAYFLREGNQGTGFIADDVHGTHHFTTVFRNYYTGWQPNCFGIPCGNQTIPVQLYAGSRYFNVIGNVLGRSGYHNNYQDVAPSGTNGVTAIFVLGWTGNGGLVGINPSITGFCIDSACASNVNYDSLTSSTLVRWGNYDVVNNAVRFVSSEFPSSLSLYANPVPASQGLPASFYLSGKPAWWNVSIPFPANGPDVTGGNISGVGGFANNIPAQVCFLNFTGHNPIHFDP